MAPSSDQTPKRHDDPSMMISNVHESFQNQIIDERHGLGLPRKYHDIELLECGLVLVAWICAILALVAIFNVRVAAFLGQTHQLIVVGFFLSITAYCLQGRSTKFLIAVEILLGDSSLQNLEAILQMDCSSSGTSFHLRIVIVMLFALPLGLSVAYKSFTGGETITTVSSRSMDFGMTAPPGTNNTGYGLSLFSTTLLPYWSSPHVRAPYGYSMWSESSKTVAILDSPLEQHMYDFQATLRPDESAVIEATVSAVQADMVLEWNKSNREDLDKAELLKYFGYTPGNASLFSTNEALMEDYFFNVSSLTDFIYSSCRTAGIAYGPPDSYVIGTRNNTFFATSRSDTPLSDSGSTFLDSTQGFTISLKRYRGTWNVTRSTAVLLKAQLLTDAPLDDHRYSFADVSATVFQDTYYRFETWISMLVEFDWKYPWARFDTVTCDPASPATQKYQSNITTDTAFVAAMVWSRVATKWGPTSAQYGNLSIEGLVKGDTKYSATVNVEIHTQTLKRKWPLAVVILIMPTLTTLVVLVQWLPLLKGSPVSSGFGLISLLAAVDGKSLDLLKGAGYSGKLSRKVKAIFTASRTGGEEGGAILSGHGHAPGFKFGFGTSQSLPLSSSVSMTLTPHVPGSGGRMKGVRLRTKSVYG